MQVIAVVSGKGGVGKSTLTANIAVALALRGKRVLILDLDPQNAQRIHLGMDPEEVAGLSREGVSTKAIFESPFGVQFIPFGKVLDNELVEFGTCLGQNRSWLAQRLESLQMSNFDYVLIDTPPGASVFLQQALFAATRALVVLLPDAASMATIPRIMGLIEEHTATNPKFQGSYFLINQMPTRSLLSHKVRNTLMEHYSKQMVPIAIQKDVGVAQALAFERPVLHYEPSCPAGQNILSTADWLISSCES